MKDLQIINVSNNNITKLEHIDHLKDLMEIDLSNNRIKQFYDGEFNSTDNLSKNRRKWSS